jgi:hypothetical protein
VALLAGFCGSAGPSTRSVGLIDGNQEGIKQALPLSIGLRTFISFSNRHGPNGRVAMVNTALTTQPWLALPDAHSSLILKNGPASCCHSNQSHGARIRRRMAARKGEGPADRLDAWASPAESLRAY